MPSGRLSIIVPAHNARDELPRCIEALLPGATEHGAEIVVADDASTDGTPEIAAALGATVVRLEQNAGPSAARNLGAAHAAGEYLFFVDADITVHIDAVSRVIDFFKRNPRKAAIFGSYDRDPAARGTLTRYRNLLHHFVHQHGRSEASTFWSGCGAIRRDLFEEMGGFDEHDYPRCIEDIELGYRLRQAGHEIFLDKKLLCTHLKRWTLMSVIKTDVFCRAIPWARLNRNRRSAPNDLNIKASQKISVALTGLLLIFLLIGAVQTWGLLAAGACLLTVVLLNIDLFAFFARTQGLGFALQCIPLHLLYFFYSGVSFLWFSAGAALGIPVPDGNRGDRT